MRRNVGLAGNSTRQLKAWSESTLAFQKPLAATTLLLYWEKSKIPAEVRTEYSVWRCKGEMSYDLVLSPNLIR